MNKSYAKHILEHWDVPVFDIPTSEEDESDFIATFNSCKVLIEEKIKLDNPAILAERKETLLKGEIHSVSTPLRRNNRLSGILRKAAKQLKSSSDYDHDYRIVWFTGNGVHGEAQYEQFIATIYGSTKIIEMNQSHYMDCYFFRNSDFHRYSDIIDGAVVAYISGTDITAKFCLNPLSNNYDTIKQSSLVAHFEHAIEDPIESELCGEAYVVDSDIDRNDQQAVLRYIQSKYGTEPLMNMDLGHSAATVLVPEIER